MNSSVVLMSAEENKAIVRRFIKAYNNRNLDVFEELVAEDYVDHTHEQQGRDIFKQLFTLAFEGFPDWYESIEDMIAEGEWVWVRVSYRNTHRELESFWCSITPYRQQDSHADGFLLPHS